MAVAISGERLRPIALRAASHLKVYAGLGLVTAGLALIGGGAYSIEVLTGQKAADPVVVIGRLAIFFAVTAVIGVSTFVRARRATAVAELALSPQHSFRFDGKKLAVAKQGAPLPALTFTVPRAQRAQLSAIAEFPQAKALPR